MMMYESSEFSQVVLGKVKQAISEYLWKSTRLAGISHVKREEREISAYSRKIFWSHRRPKTIDVPVWFETGLTGL